MNIWCRKQSNATTNGQKRQIILQLMYLKKVKEAYRQKRKKIQNFTKGKIYMYNIIYYVADKCTSALHKVLTMITGGNHFWEIVFSCKLITIAVVES